MSSDTVRWAGLRMGETATVIARHKTSDGREFLWCLKEDGVPVTQMPAYVDEVEDLTPPT